MQLSKLINRLEITNSITRHISEHSYTEQTMLLLILSSFRIVVLLPALKAKSDYSLRRYQRVTGLLHLQKWYQSTSTSEDNICGGNRASTGLCWIVLVWHITEKWMILLLERMDLENNTAVLPDHLYNWLALVIATAKFFSPNSFFIAQQHEQKFQQHRKAMIGYVVQIFTKCRQTAYDLFLFADDLHHLTPFKMTESATVKNTWKGKPIQDLQCSSNRQKFKGHTTFTI